MLCWWLLVGWGVVWDGDGGGVEGAVGGALVGFGWFPGDGLVVGEVGF